MTAPSVLYRGSPKRVNRFEPEEVHPDDVEKLAAVGIRAPKVIWATPFQKNSLAFAALSGRVTYLLNTIGAPNQPAQSITFVSNDWRDKLDFNDVVYSYHLDPANFIKVNNREYVTTEPVIPITVEEFTIREILDQFQVAVDPSLA